MTKRTAAASGRLTSARRGLAGALAVLAACAALADEAVLRVAVRHSGFHTDEPEERDVTQVRDGRGWPVEYRMTVESVVCLDGACKTTHVQMAWDALGHYLRYELPAGVELEKGVAVAQPGGATEWDSAPFAKEDYAKLEAILRDENSLLKQQKLANFAQPKAQGRTRVDGITGATPTAAREAVVAGAALTCFNLWHWANGDVCDAVRELTHQRCTREMLLSFLASDKAHDVLFALEHLRLHAVFDPEALRAVEAKMAGGDRDRIDYGLFYLNEALPDRDRHAEHVAAVLGAGSGESRAALLDRLASAEAMPDAFYDAVAATLPSWGGYYEIHLFLRLAERQGRAPARLVSEAAQLLDRTDFFIARRAYAFLSGLPSVDPQTAARLQAFREKAAREGRSL